MNALSLPVVEMVEKFQCPGCMSGPDPENCPNFELDSKLPIGDNKMNCCVGHYPGTRMSGVGQINLGLPKGFNRVGYNQQVGQDRPQELIRLFPSPEKSGSLGHGVCYDKLNVAVWAMEQDNYLFVRCYMPRTNRTFVDVIKGGKKEDICPDAIDVGEFYDEID